MLNILLIEDDMIQAINIVNYISTRRDNVRLCSISTTGKNALKIIETYKINLIILDVGLPDISGIDIIEHISNTELIDYKQSVIIFSCNNEYLSTLNNNPYVFDFVYKLNGLQKLLTAIDRFIIYKKSLEDMDLIKDKIYNQLSILNFNLSYNGTIYLVDCILELYKRQDNFCSNLNKYIYPILAQKYNTTSNTIKCDITRAVKLMYYDCPEDRVKEYFSYTYCVKPKVKEVIFTILNKIKTP